MLRCVLFDMDGTLVDTAADLGYALNEVLREHGLPPKSAQQIRPIASSGARGLLDLGFNLNPSDEAYQPLRLRLLDIYRQNLTRESRLFDGMDDVLDGLRQRGISWGIVTNKPAWLTDPLVEQLKLRITPVCVVSGDSAAHPKPHPAPILMACEKSGFPVNDCVYVGDAGRDIEAGRQAGMRTLAAAYGYIENDDSPINWGADGLIESPAELLAWVDALAESVRGL